jgi:hypothetical protein
MAAPRAPLPPLPEPAGPALVRESFDWAWAPGLTESEVVIPNYGTLRESFSGYALQRLGTVVPFLVPALDAHGRTNVACAAGAVRLWVTPYWSSRGLPGGTGPGTDARLVELIVADRQGTAAVWSLQITPDGTAVVLLGHGEGGPVPLLKAPLDWLAGQAHCVVLSYGPQTALFLDGQLTATGPGTLAAPASVAALVWGSTATGDLSAGADLDEPAG